jgi:gluconolactonase
LARDLATVKAADFIAFDASFFDVIGTDATVEKLIAFPGVAHVHEAPVYLPETNELLFSDTSALGWLWAIEVDTLTVPFPLLPCHDSCVMRLTT